MQAFLHIRVYSFALTELWRHSKRYSCVICICSGPRGPFRVQIVVVEVPSRDAEYVFAQKWRVVGACMPRRGGLESMQIGIFTASSLPYEFTALLINRMLKLAERLALCPSNRHSIL